MTEGMTNKGKARVLKEGKVEEEVVLEVSYNKATPLVDLLWFSLKILGNPKIKIFVFVYRCC
jgi:hypothetical protein